jgi:hypothetical protein
MIIRSDRSIDALTISRALRSSLTGKWTAYGTSTVAATISGDEGGHKKIVVVVGAMPDGHTLVNDIKAIITDFERRVGLPQGSVSVAKIR